MITRIHKVSIIAFFLLLTACSKSPQLENTPLALRELSEIGELITAEYYGEVIISLISIKDTDLRKEMKEDLGTYQQLYNDLLSLTKNENVAYRRFKRKEYHKDYRFKRLTKISDLNERDFVANVLTEMNWTSFESTFESQITEYISKREFERKEGEIVYLGRGWVRAGFDLTQIDFQKDIVHRPDSIIILNLDPIILDADINPWLVPGEIVGFEIIKMKNKVTLDEIESVKRACKAGLKQDAVESGIYNFALSAGEESLEGLFGLMDLPGNNKISVVEIRPTKYFDYKVDFLADGRIDTTEFKDLRGLYLSDFPIKANLDEIWFDALYQQHYNLNKLFDELHEETLTEANYEEWPGLYKEFKEMIKDTLAFKEWIKMN